MLFVSTFYFLLKFYSNTKILFAFIIKVVAIVFKDLDEILVVGLPVYCVLLLTMCWRSLARAVDSKCFLYTFCAVGSVVFVISDGLICFDMFLIKVPNARVR